MPSLPIVLFFDRNYKKDTNIKSALDAFREFGKKQFGDQSVICEHLKYQPNRFVMIWGIPSKYKQNTN